MPVKIVSAVILSAVLVLACHDSAQQEASGPRPLADVASSMEPAAVWQLFQQLTQVPRPSHHEERATAFVAEFGRALGLETAVDAAGNVLIRKPATTGREGRAGVVLQAHLDMVPQSSEVGFDFETRPIRALVDAGWVFADGTTLGADAGIGVALIMAVLQATDIAHGPIEALFTTNEEDGMDGITGLAPDALDGRLYLNVDNENEGSFVISSAGAVYLDVRATYEEIAPPPQMSGHEVTVSGLTGGHSGIDIDKGRGSAHQLLARLLVNAPAELGVRVASLAGGDTYNVIPRKATAVVAVPTVEVAAFGAYVTAFDATVRSELATTDAGVTVTARPATVPARVMDAGSQAALLGAVLAGPQGVYRMSAEVPGIVETSCNLGILTVAEGRLTGGALARSAIDSERDAQALRFAEVYEQAGATVEMGRGYASWPPNPESPLLTLMQRVYRETFGTEAAVTAVHAGLETSTVGTKFPGMDMISVGPTIRDVHSPDERLEIASVPKAYQLLVATLAAVQ